MISDWRLVKAEDIIDFNPRESLPKNALAKKIGMEKLEPFTKCIHKFELSQFSGGSKFRNGDTLMARITPCLENGKTAQVSILDKNEIGFGSTEYIVMRAKPMISDKDYIFYLATSPILRDRAIKSMVGSSGRQRVQQDVLSNTEFLAPPYEEQKAIGTLLSTFDNKIKQNTQINDNLEQQMQTMFTEMFGNSIKNLPIENCAPLGNFVSSIDNRGKTPPLSAYETEFPIIDVRALSGNVRIVDYKNCTKYVDEETYNNWFRSGHPKPFDILISTVGSLAEMKLFFGDKGCIAQNVVAFRSNSISPLYLYQYLTHIRNDLVAYNIGSVQPSIKVTHIIKHLIFVPNESQVELFHELASSMTRQIFNNCRENEQLIQLRDILLPKLMSGELDVSGVQF